MAVKPPWQPGEATPPPPPLAATPGGRCLAGCLGCGTLWITLFVLQAVVRAVYDAHQSLGSGLWVLTAVVVAIGLCVYVIIRCVRRPDRRGPGPRVETMPQALAIDASGRVVMPRGIARLYEGRICGICGAPIAVGGEFIECPDCRQWFHEACWAQVGGCATAGCPSAEVERRRVRARAGDAPVAAGATAILNVGVCPYCQTPVAASAQFVTCPACRTPYHPDCWQENRGCAVYGCTVRLSS